MRAADKIADIEKEKELFSNARRNMLRAQNDYEAKDKSKCEVI